MPRIRSLLAVAGALAGSAAPVRGQVLPGHMPATATGVPWRGAPAASVPDRNRDQDPVAAVLGAVIGGVVGGATGILVGMAVWDASRPPWSGECHWLACGYLGGMPLAWFGEAVGLGIGAHLGNGRRGNVIAPLAASLVVLAAVGIAGDNGRLAERDQWVIPVLQIIAAVVAETAVGSVRVGR
jgi:hypothetical protein